MLTHRTPHQFWGTVIPGLAKREPGIHWTEELVEEWIPGSCCARPGMTAANYATISCSVFISSSGAVTFGA
jgi:hypothetical protein